MPGHEDKDLAFSMLDNVLYGQKTLALRRPGITQRQQPAQSTVSRSVGGVTNHMNPIFCHQPRPDEELHPYSLGRHMGPHHTGQCIAISNADGRKLLNGLLACLGILACLAEKANPQAGLGHLVAGTEDYIGRAGLIPKRLQHPMEHPLADAPLAVYLNLEGGPRHRRFRMLG